LLPFICFYFYFYYEIKRKKQNCTGSIVVEHLKEIIVQFFIVAYIILDVFVPLKQAIPDSIAGLQKLVELDVSSNVLEFLPDSIGLLVNLKILNVSGNKLTALPETIALCRCLSSSF